MATKESMAHPSSTHQRGAHQRCAHPSSANQRGAHPRGAAKRAIALALSAAISLVCFAGFPAPGASGDSGIPVDYLVISPNSPHIEVGETITFQATVYPANATEASVDWLISNSLAARIIDFDDRAGTCIVIADQDGTAFLMAIARSNGVISGVNIVVGEGGTEGNIPIEDDPVTMPTPTPTSESTDPTPMPTPTPDPPSQDTPSQDPPRDPPPETTPMPPDAPPSSDWANPFTDVRERSWYFSNVQYAHQKGLFSGTTDTTFSPNEPMTRGMIVTVLGRLNKADVELYSANSFADVRPSRYYAKYIEWARDLSIVSGVGDNQFEPETPITREQLAAMLDNYSRAMGFLLPDIIERQEFEDNSRISRYARGPVDTMVRAGVINGRDGNIFDPKAACTRAEVAAMIHRYALAARI